MRQAILQSGDTSLIDKFEEWTTLKKQMNYLMTSPSGRRFTNLDSLNNVAEVLEKKLIKKAQAFGDLQASFKINWESVLHKLKEDEASIEFVAFDYHNGKRRTDSIYYCALILRPEYEYPKMVFLCEERPLDSLVEMGSVAYQNIMGSKAYDLIWRPLDSLMAGVKTVFYSPGGLLNKVSFAAIQTPKGNYLSDIYDLRTMGSTRILTMNDKPYRIKKGQKAVLFGGIDYWADSISMKNMSLAFHREENEETANINPLKGGNKTVTEWMPLDRTLDEVKAVEADLQGNGIEVTTYTGKEAIEERVKDLSNHSPDILFLSTHGFSVSLRPDAS
jgi:hypothetical protein